MSIYSGFATRSQQQYYDQTIFNTISTLLMRITKFYRGEIVDENRFIGIIAKQCKIIHKMEKRKYLQPKYAQLLEYFLRIFQQQTQGIQQSRFQSKKSLINPLFRTFSELDQQIGHLKMKTDLLKFDNQEYSQMLDKIDQVLPKSSKKNKSKTKRPSVNSHSHLYDIKDYRVSQLPSLNLGEQTVPVKAKINGNISSNLINNHQSRQLSKNSQKGQRGSLQRQKDHQQRKYLSKVPKFRAKMYVR